MQAADKEVGLLSNENKTKCLLLDRQQGCRIRPKHKQERIQLCSGAVV